MRLAVLFVLATLAGPVQAQVPEADVEQALAGVVSAAHSDADDLAPRLACISGVSGALAPRPCIAPDDAVRIAAVRAYLRRAFPSGATMRLDWLTAREAPYGSVTAVQVKVGDDEPPGLEELTFIRQGPHVLLADAGPELLWRPQAPVLETARDSVVAQFEGLMRVVGQPEEAAAFIGCWDRATRTAAGCDWNDPEERRLVEGFARVLAGIQASGPTAWGIEDYQTDTESEGTWHVLRVGYLTGDERRGLYAAFMLVDGQYLLGDLDPAEGP